MKRTLNPRGAPRKVLVVGMGNPDRGDDGVGALVVRSVAGRLPADVSLVVRSDDALSLIEDWAGFDALVCVDAAAPVTMPGRIHRIDLASEQLVREMSFASSHAFGVAEAIELARTLGLAPRDMVVYAIEGACFDPGTPMTPEVAAAVDEVAGRVVAEVGRLRQTVKEIEPYA
ncbi:hydrogenase maturation protease [Pandoraea communis]|uniref:Hydrogenase maturation protease n=1 Tax=Pandoraea communis TaxID=2508297 RepID=A0A5E4UPV8_9BURK|nr:hydrogenase maturation protease [Pandoraea communis]MDM8355496.1 hydrogenase maturation protease [Pandoraea communis]VVE01967.1 hydrogenase maturation protease [Pandoraea communis]